MEQQSEWLAYKEVEMRATNIAWDTDGEDVVLPTEIELPDGMVDEDEISDCISDQTGYCHMGFCVEE